MKTLLVIALLGATALMVVCAPKDTPQPKAPPAGKFCIDVGADSVRVEEAFGWTLKLTDTNGNIRPATTEEIEAAIFTWVQNQTQDYERRKNMHEFTPPPFGTVGRYVSPVPVTPTPTPVKK